MNNAKFQAKTKVLAKLFNEGFNTEKEILNLDLNRLLSINSITIADLRLIAKLQKYLKNNKLISYLSGADEEQKE
jgi:hypothetical protein